MKSRNPGGPSTITVHITATNVNGQDVDVSVTDFVRLGELIPQRFAVLAAEAGVLADEARKLEMPVVRRNRTR